MRAGILIAMVFLISACKKEIERNLDDWEGEWKISTGAEGNTSGMHEFLSNEWKDANIIHPDFGTLTIDKEGSAALIFQNDDFSDSLTPFTMEGYLHVYGRSHLEFYGMKVTASLDMDKPVGKEVGNDGNMVFWMRDNGGKERVAELDGNAYYGISPGFGVRWLIFTKK